MIILFFYQRIEYLFGYCCVALLCCIDAIEQKETLVEISFTSQAFLASWFSTASHMLSPHSSAMTMDSSAGLSFGWIKLSFIKIYLNFLSFSSIGRSLILANLFLINPFSSNSHNSLP